MLRRVVLLICAGWLGTAAAQEPFTNSSLNGKYYFVQLLVTAPGDRVAESRSLGGAITFNGAGSYTYVVEGAAGGQGTYALAGAGNVTLASPIQNTEQVSAYLSGDRNVLLGASTQTAGTAYDIFVAVRAPASAVTNALLNGAYTGASVEFSGGLKSALVSLAANGNGQFGRVTVLGHAADQGGRAASQQAANCTYSLTSDGGGTATFGAAANLFAGDRAIFVSQDGNYILGRSTAGAVFVAVKNAAAPASFEGRYWIAELTVDGSSFSAASGSLRAFANGRALISERLRQDARTLDYAGLNFHAINTDGSGALGPRLAQGLTNMALGAGSFVGAQIGPLDKVTSQYGVFFGVRAPVFQGTGVFLDPAGVVNGASFAPMPHPVAPGAVAALFGSGLASRESRATSFPLPTKLDDVAVTVNGTPAPLFFASAGQVSIQLPYGLKGNWVAIKLSNARGSSNEVTAALAPTSPGVFSYGDSQSPSRGVVLHADYSLVTPDNPAHPGETVMIWLTGLGDLAPPVPTGAANPASPLSWAVDAQVNVIFGGEVASTVQYVGGAPGFAALNQINAVIPLTVPVGTNVPVAISTGNAYADLVDIPIAR